jgi:WD40 repeat protein
VRPWIAALLGFAFVWMAPTKATTPTAPSPRLVLQSGQGNTIVAAWSPDGRLIASGGSDGRVLLWSASSGRQLHAFKTEGMLTTLQFSGDGASVMAGTSSGRVEMWNVASGRSQPAAQFGQGPIRALVVSPDDRVVMAAAETGQVVVADLTTRAHALIDIAPAALSTAALSPDLGTVAVAPGRDPHVLLFDARTGVAKGRLSGHTARINALRFSPDGALLASGGDDETIRLWDARSGALVRVIEGHGTEIESLDFSSDGRTLAAAGVRLSLWEVASGERRASAPRPREYLVQTAFSPRGDSILAVDSTGMSIWNSATGAPVRELRRMAMPVWRLAFSPDGQKLLVDNELWDFASGQSTKTWLGTGPDGYVQWTRDGTRVLAPGARGPTLWDAATWREVLALDVAHATLLSAALSPDGRTIAAGMGDGQVRLWDARTGAPRDPLVMPQRSVRHVEYSPDGRWLAAGGGDGHVAVWHVSDRRQVHVTTGNAPLAFRFTPDGKALALAGIDGRVVLHVLDGSPNPLVLEHGAPVRVLRYSDDGRWLATGGFLDHRIRLWDARLGTLVHTFEGHDDAIRDIAFSPDGRMLASTSDDATTRLWAREGGRAIATLAAVHNPRDWSWSSVVVAPDGRFDAPHLESLQALHWILPEAPLDPLPLEAFMRDYFEPRLLPRLLAGEPMRPVEPLAGIRTRTPLVRITDVVADPADASRVQVDLDVESWGGGAQDLRLFRDGQLVGAVDGPVEFHPRTRRATVRFPVSLPVADIRRSVALTAYAFNDDRIKSETAYRLHAFEPPMVPGPRRAILVNIGVDVYESPAWDLGFAASDARLIGTTLAARMEAMGSFDEIVRIELVSDPDTPDAATKAAIREAVLSLGRGVGTGASQRPVGPDDVVIISFSGHGAVDAQGAFHLLPHDIGASGSRLLTPQVLARGIRDDELGEWLRGVDAGEMVLILDACHSAAAIAQPGFKPGPMGSRGLGQLAYDKGLRILAATQPDDVALESEATQHGLLSYALVKEGIEQGLADFRPRNERIAVPEWLAYALGRVPGLAAEVQAGAVKSRGAPVRVRNASGQAGAPATRGLQRPSLFDFRRQAIDVEIAMP